MKPIILLVDNDLANSSKIKDIFSREGIVVKLADTLRDAYRRLDEAFPNLLIIEAILPDGSGTSLCRELHSQHGERLPIVIQTEKAGESGAIDAFSAGAIDYIRKPCGPIEMLLKIKRYLKYDSELEVGGVHINLKTREATACGQPIELRRREFDLLGFLARRKGEVVTRREILDQLHFSLNFRERSLDSHISHLRSALERTPGAELTILSIYGVGYKLIERQVQAPSRFNIQAAG